MNRGVLANQGSDVWRRYEPKIKCASNTRTSLTDPSVDVGGAHYFYNRIGTEPFGRFNVDEDGLCVAEIQFTSAYTTDWGDVGTNPVYVFSLPAKAFRPTGTGSVCRVPIGDADAYWSFVSGGTVPWSACPIAPTLADPWTSLDGQEDYYCQLLAPYHLARGSDTIVSGASKVTVSGNSVKTFSAYDVEIRGTDADIGVGTYQFFVDGIGDHAFDVNGRGGATADCGFDWRVRAEPPTGQHGAVVGPRCPWRWGDKATSLGPYGNIFMKIQFEVAR